MHDAASSVQKYEIKYDGEHLVEEQEKVKSSLGWFVRLFVSRIEWEGRWGAWNDRELSCGEGERQSGGMLRGWGLWCMNLGRRGGEGVPDILSDHFLLSSRHAFSFMMVEWC